MCASHTAPAEAHAPDADRDETDSPPLMSEWAAHLVTLLILFLLEIFPHLRRRRTHRAPLHAVQPQPRRDGLVPVRRHRDVAPQHPAKAKLLRAIKALLNDMQGPGGDAQPQSHSNPAEPFSGLWTGSTATPSPAEKAPSLRPVPVRQATGPPGGSFCYA